MRIKRIKFKNYRQYRNVEIILKKKADNDVNIFIGRNGVGKTNILNAMNWCLYGDEPHFSKESQRIPMLNLEAINEAKDGKDQDVVVEIEMDVGNSRTYTFIRKATYRVYEGEILPKLQGSTFQSLNNDEKGNTINNQDEDAKEIVGGLVSQEMREFFFFDGERLDNYFKIATAQNIMHAVFVISQIDLLRNRIGKNLNSILKDLRNDTRKESPKIDEIGSALEGKEDELGKVKQKIEDYKRQIEISKEEISDCSDKLRGIPDIEALEEERNMLKQERKHKKDLLDKKKKEKQDCLFEYQKIFMLYSAIDKSILIINQKKRDKELPPTIDKSLLEEIVKNKNCSICGTPLSVEKEKRVRDLLSEIKLSSVISEALLKMENPLLTFKDKIQNFSKKMNNLTDEINDYIKNIDSSEQKISKIDKKLIGYSDEKIRTWQEQRRKHEDLLSDNQKMLGKYEMIEESLRKEVDELTKQYELELKKETKIGFIKKQMDFCSKALDVVNKTEEVIVNETRKQIQSETNNIFLHLIWKKNTFREVKIESDFNINLIHKMGYECLGTVGSGERELLALSFILALQSTSNFSAPILIDTPVSRLSFEHRVNFAKVLLDISSRQQTILLFTPSEYSEEVSKVLDLKYSNKYILKLKSNEKEIELEEVLNV